MLDFLLGLNLMVVKLLSFLGHKSALQVGSDPTLATINPTSLSQLPMGPYFIRERIRKKEKQILPKHFWKSFKKIERRLLA